MEPKTAKTIRRAVGGAFGTNHVLVHSDKTDAAGKPILVPVKFTGKGTLFDLRNS